LESNQRKHLTGRLFKRGTMKLYRTRFALARDYYIRREIKRIVKKTLQPYIEEIVRGGKDGRKGGGIPATSQRARKAKIVRAAVKGPAANTIKRGHNEEKRKAKKWHPI